MCTSNGERKILMTVGESVCSGANVFMRVTRPSAGETTTLASVGGTRVGSRKKKAINKTMKMKNANTYQKPKAADTRPNISGTTMNGILSRAMANLLFLAKRGRVLVSTSPDILRYENCVRVV